MNCNLKPRTIYHADNIDILRGMNSKCIDLIYLDPPFNKNELFYSIFKENGKKKKVGFKDVWGKEDIKDEWVELIQDQWSKLYQYFNGIENVGIKGAKYYLIYMAVRLIEIYRVLKDTGSIYLHCDSTMSHYIKIMMDCIFDEKNFRNEIVWHYHTGGNTKNWYVKNSDTIFFYAKSDNSYFNLLKVKRYTKSKSRKEGKHNLGHGEKEFFKDENGIYQFVNLDNVWQIPYINSQSKERTGYLTQKPLALLSRIVESSSNEGDIVLDPFCGCATTCVASENLNREWIGIDKEKETINLINKRLKKEIPKNLFRGDSNYETEIPKRTDYSHRIPNGTKETLYGKQKGICNGCGEHLRIQLLDIDHIIPKSSGGTNEAYNLQLLCGSCNSLKSNRTMTHLKKRLWEEGILS